MSSSTCILRVKKQQYTAFIAFISLDVIGLLVFVNVVRNTFLLFSDSRLPGNILAGTANKRNVVNDEIIRKQFTARLNKEAQSS